MTKYFQPFTFFEKKVKGQKGLSLYLVIIIMAILLGVVLGITAILASQLKMIRGMENSVIAFYAAETGIEEILRDVYADVYTGSEIEALPYDRSMSNGASYTVDIACCDPASPGPNGCVWNGTSCPSQITIDPNCPGIYYCMRSVGSFAGVKRAIRVSF